MAVEIERAVIGISISDDWSIVRVRTGAVEPAALEVEPVAVATTSNGSVDDTIGLEEEISVVTAGGEELRLGEFENLNLNGIVDLTNTGVRDCSSRGITCSKLAVKGGADVVGEGGMEKVVVVVEGGGGIAKLEVEAPVDGGGKEGTTKPSLGTELVDVADGRKSWAVTVVQGLAKCGDCEGPAEGSGGRGKGVTEGGGGGVLLSVTLMLIEVCLTVLCEVGSGVVMLVIGD